MQQPVWNFEEEPFDAPYDETSVNLRAYFDRMDDGKMREYDPAWSDEQVRDWDRNFTEVGNLLVPCCERDIDIEEYREVIAQAIAYRDRLRGSIFTDGELAPPSGIRGRSALPESIPD